MHSRPIVPRVVARPGYVAVVMAVVLGSTLASTQSQEAPDRFDVVSVRRNTSGDANLSLTASPKQLRATNMPLRAFIQNTFRIRPFQLIGAPGWTESERFDIVAAVEKEVSPAQLQRMMESLLVDRFKLAFTRETRTMDSYALRLAGPKPSEKLTASAEGECPAPEVARKDPTAVPCGYPRASATRIEGRRVTLAALASVLSTILQRPVTDETGIAGVFDIAVDYQFAVQTPGGGPAGESVFTAMREQLGLAIEATRGPVPVIVIEHIERPSEN